MSESNSMEEKTTKTIGRISKLFQKKNKKTLSSSNLSLSDTLQQQHISQSLSSRTSSINTYVSEHDRNSYLEARSIPQNTNNDAAKLTRQISIKSTQSVNPILQQRNLLRDLEFQKASYASEAANLSEQLKKTRQKINQRSEDLKTLQKNYQAHLKTTRSFEDDPQKISEKLISLRKQIKELAAILVPHAEEVTSKNLSTLWINLSDSIQQLCPLEPARLQMLTEKFMMDVLVQNLNLHVFPISCNQAFSDLQQWFEKHGRSIFSTRLRQELALVVQKKEGDVKNTWKKTADRTWHHLYKGLQRAYPTYLAKKTSEDHVIDPKAAATAAAYGEKLRDLVEYSMALGLTIKGQEACITAVDVREGAQQLDTNLMEDVDGKQSGTVAFCICPPFVIKLTDHYEPLLKGIVFCFEG